MIKEQVKKFIPYIGISVLAFVIGRYTMTTSTIKEAETKYKKTLAESIVSIDREYNQYLSEQTEQIKKDYDLRIKKLTQTSKVTVINKDGTTTITEKTKTKEDQNSKSSEVINSNKTDKKTELATTESAKSTLNTETKTSKETIKTTSTAQWRLYSIIEIVDFTGERVVGYGAGIMYDIGPFNVGTLGIYAPSNTNKSIGLTLGITL